MDYQDKPVDLNSNVVYEKTNYKNLNRLKEDTLLNNNSSIKSFLLPTDFEKPTDRKRSLSLTSDPTRKFSSGSFTNLSADKQLYSSTSSITSPTRKYSCFSSGEDSEGDESVFLDRSEQRKRYLIRGVFTVTSKIYDGAKVSSLQLLTIFTKKRYHRYLRYAPVNVFSQIICSILLHPFPIFCSFLSKIMAIQIYFNPAQDGGLSKIVTIQMYLNPVQDGGLFGSFFPVTSTNVDISPQNFQF